MLDFSNSKILIVRDVMLDKYYFGKVDRISPEAPVPIVNIQKENPGWEVLRMSPTTLSVWEDIVYYVVLSAMIFCKKYDGVTPPQNKSTPSCCNVTYHRNDVRTYERTNVRTVRYVVVE